MKEKILSKLPSINALRKRIYIIEDKIVKCEKGIPEEYWCDKCKGLLQKIESLEKKKKIIKEDSLYKVYGGTYTSTLTYKYKCSRCGRTWVEGKRLGIFHDLSEDVERCSDCDGIIEKIVSQPTPTYRYKCSQCGRVFVNDDEHLWPPLGVIINSKKEMRCGKCAGIVYEIKPSRK